MPTNRKRWRARLLFFSFLLFSTAAFADYLSELQARAGELKLSEDRYWSILLHYKPRWFGGVKSENDDPTFFFAPDGKTNPQSELLATLAAFFRPAETDLEKQHVQCRFVARYHWLKEKLSFDSARLPEQACPRYDEWKKGIAPYGLSLVFASFYVNNPASMFGHTMLRFEQNPADLRPELLSYAANYAATLTEDMGALYAIKGLTGGYRGTFSLYPYYIKVQEYSNYESRDLWEYHLTLIPDQTIRVVEHLWELGHSYFDYYFIDENCSYHILGLIEAGNPSVDLQSRFYLFVAPSDTVKYIYRKTPSVDHVVYRPSLLSQFHQELSILRPNEIDHLHRLIKKKESLNEAPYQDLSNPEKARVADTAIKFENLKHREDRSSKYYQQLLADRSQYGVVPDSPNQPFSTPPHLGHESTLWGLGAGADSNQSFEELRFRLAYHDLLAQEDGYPPNAEINLLRLRLRFYNEEKEVAVEDGTIANVVSLFPIDSFFVKSSWQAGFGFHSQVNSACGRCTAAYVRGGAGLAYGNRVTAYIYGNLYSEMAPWSNMDYRVGPQGEGGLVFHLMKRWALRGFGLYDYSPIGAPTIDWRAGGENRITLARNIELRIEGSKFQEGWEALGAFQFYY